MGKKLKNYNIEKHTIFTYVDDTQHIVASKNHKDLGIYIQDMHDMIIKLYNHNSLKLNGEKTEFLNFTRDNNVPESKFTIIDNYGNIIEQKNTIKVLGYIINQKNDLENHISALFGKISKSYNNIKGAIPFLSE